MPRTTIDDMAGPIRVVIVTALQLEFVAVRAHLSECSDVRHRHGSIYTSGTFVSGTTKFDVLLVESGPGNSSATDETARALDYWSADIALFIGVAGGIKDVALGDVVAADEVYNLESGKARAMFDPRPHSKSCAYALIQIAKLISRNRSWQKRIPAAVANPPNSVIGSIVSGEKVVASLDSDAHRLIRASYGHCLAVEMEAYGFLTAVHSGRRVDAMVIRGISDLIEGKADADASGSQPNAVTHACAFAFELLSEYGNGLKGAGVDTGPHRTDGGATTSGQHTEAVIGSDVHAEASLRLAVSTGEIVRKAFAQTSATVLNWPTTVKGNQRIATPSEAELIKLIDTEASSTTLVLGVKGVGKSALLASVGLRAVESGHAVLAIRADRIPAEMDSPAILASEFLGLPVPMDEAVAIVAASSKVVVLIDQLDSVSELTDRKSNRLNMLINAIQRLSGQKNVHVIASSRELDFRHDSRLNSLKADELRLEPPKWEEVAPVLSNAGRNPNQIGQAAREILCIPWNLNLYLRLPASSEVVESEQALLESIWRQFVAKSDAVSGRPELLERIANRMSYEEELFVPSSVADDLSAARDALLHDDILTEDKLSLKLAFRHQTFFDHTLARLFASGSKSLADHVLTNQDGLFVRPAMLRGLELLRPTAPAQYEQEVKRLLQAKPRTHIHSLLIEFIAQRSDPKPVEVDIVLPLLAGSDGPLILRAASGSVGWFSYFKDNTVFASWMKAEPDRAALCVGVLVAALSFDPSGVRDLLTRYWISDPRFDRLIVSVASYVKTWDDAWADLVSKAARRTHVDVFYLANAVAQTAPAFAGKILMAQLEREFDRADAQTIEKSYAPNTSADDDVYSVNESDRQKNFAELITSSEDGRYALIELAETSPIDFVEQVWPWLERVLQNCRYLGKRGAVYTDVYPPLFSYRDELYPLIGALHSALSKLATESPDAFVKFASTAASTEYLALHVALVQGYMAIVTSNPKAVLDYLVSDKRRFAIGTFHDELQFSVSLIRALVPQLDADERNRLEDAILAFDMYMGEYERIEAEHRRDLKKYSRGYRVLLLRAFPAGTLSRQRETLRLSEEAQIPEYCVERTQGSWGFVGARMNGEELSKASDENVLNVMDEVREREHNGRDYSRKFGIGRSGGTRQQARAFGELAEKEHQRVLSLLGDMVPEKHESYAAAAVDGLAKSSLESSRLISLIQELDSRGFASDDFRESAASAIETRASKQDTASREAVPILQRWIAEVNSPKPKDETDIETDDQNDQRGESIIFSHGAMFTLTHGRGAITRAMATTYSQREPVDVASLVELVKSRSRSEKHLGVLAEVMLYASALFVDRLRGTEAYDELIKGNPDVLTQRPAIHALSHVCGFVRPDDRFEEWLELLAAKANSISLQAYGELLFLQAARTDSKTAKKMIAERLDRGDTHIVRGLAHGAANGWFEPHCRELATDILCAATLYEDVGVVNALNKALMPSEDRFPIDNHTDRLIAAVISQPTVLAKVAGNLMESIAPSAGTYPEIVSKVCKAILQSLGSKLTVAGPHREVAGPMTSAIITLHRQSSFRAIGLELFEELIRFGVHEAAAALELIDRSSTARYAMPFIRRPRRRRVKRGMRRGRESS